MEYLITGLVTALVTVQYGMHGISNNWYCNCTIQYSWQQTDTK